MKKHASGGNSTTKSIPKKRSTVLLRLKKSPYLLKFSERSSKTIVIFQEESIELTKESF
jgi:hypothetical protein